MSDPAAQIPAKPAFGSETTPVLAKLRAYREKNGGEESFTLKNTGVVVSFPKFRPYDLWQKAQRVGGKDSDRMQLHYIIALCRFDGDRLRAGDYVELIPAGDHLDIVGRVFAGVVDAEEDDAAGDQGGEAGLGPAGNDPAGQAPPEAPATRQLGALGPAPSTTASSSAAATPIPS